MLLETRNELKDANLASRALKEYNKLQYDKRHKKPTKYCEGDLVLIKVLQHKPGTNRKLLSKYKGPYQIKKVQNKNRYVVIDVPDYSHTIKPLNSILSVDKIKKCINVTDNNPDRS